VRYVLLILGLVLLCVVPSSGATTYTITDLGTLGGDTSAYGINELGQVVGSSWTSDGNEHAFLWTPEEGMVDIHALPGSESAARSINDAGQVVGLYSSDKLYGKAHQPFIWEPGTGMTLIPPMADYDSAEDINNLGQVVIRSTTADGDNRAFLRQPDGSMTRLPFDLSYSINNGGQVAGWGGQGPGIWSEEGGFTSLDLFSLSSPRDINDAGDIIGDGTWQGTCLWKADTNEYVYCGSIRAYRINEAGVAVGRIQLPPRGYAHAVIWSEADGVLDLNNLLDDPADAAEWTLEYARDINNAGQIVGWGEHNGEIRAFLLRPVPEPATLGLLCLGAVFITARRRGS